MEGHDLDCLQTLPNEIILKILSLVNPATLLSVFLACKHFNRLALITYYENHGIRPPFDNASYTPKIFPGLLLAVPPPALQSLIFTFYPRNTTMLTTLANLHLFLSRLQTPIPSICLDFKQDILSSSVPLSEKYQLIQHVECVLRTAIPVNSRSHLRISTRGTHQSSSLSPLLPELNHYNPSPLPQAIHAQSPEDIHADREPKVLGMLLFTTLLGQGGLPSSRAGWAVILLALAYIGGWYFAHWKSRWRPTATQVDSGGIITKVPCIRSLTTIDIINLPGSIAPHSLVIFERLSITELEIQAPIPISWAQWAEILPNLELPSLVNLTIGDETDSEPGLSTTIIISFFLRHPLISKLTYLSPLLPALPQMHTSPILQRLSHLRALPESFSALSTLKISSNDASEPIDALPCLQKLEITARSPHSLTISRQASTVSFAAASTKSLDALTCHNAPLHLELTIPEAVDNASLYSPICLSTVPCVTILSLYWFPTLTMHLIPAFLKNFPCLKRLGLMDLVLQVSGYNGAGGDNCPGPAAFDKDAAQGSCYVWFVQEMRRCCPSLQVLLIGDVEKGLDEWEVVFAKN